MISNLYSFKYFLTVVLIISLFYIFYDHNPYLPKFYKPYKPLSSGRKGATIQVSKQLQFTKQDEYISSDYNQTVKHIITQPLSDEEFDEISWYSTIKNAIILSIHPHLKFIPNLYSIYEDYVLMMPLAKTESIRFTKNANSDLNLKTICDADDPRPECDVKTHRNYVYEELPKKTFDMVNLVCNSGLRYKVYAKIDFDVFVNKAYFHDVMKFMIDNHKRKIYYGDIMDSNSASRRIAMNGKFYAITDSLFEELCKCEFKEKDKGLEDFWFGQVLGWCIDKKRFKKGEKMVLLKSDESKVIHKNLYDQNVGLKIGRFANS
ncbi:hypothetical protein BB559_006850 [Furculomyces boomerangus]|uniref:Hexosyltransferase n=2 Tax=Harpellales TaxID=61421 RepID=A0A2T9Y039_9FUNG|nr:hypothetical protein BB559_006850 [Furculomyces boomerangus]PVZ97998.1 hypothetical protein BB558_006022 [Smittium angustum]